MEIKEDFTDPTLATFSEIQSFGLSQLQTVLGCLVTEGHCFAAGFGRRAILYHKARKIFLISAGVSSGQIFQSDFDRGKVKGAEEDTNKTAEEYN